jgi:hypothetical protein
MATGKKLPLEVIFPFAAVGSCCRGLSDSHRNRQPRIEEPSLCLLIQTIAKKNEELNPSWLY